MYIIDKNKDFYDYLSHIYGVDKSITFDRRGSVNVDDLMIADKSMNYPNIQSNSKTFVLLEVGYVQHLIKLFDFVIDEGMYERVISCSMELVRTFKDFKHYYDSPISIRGVDVAYNWTYFKPRSYRFDRPFNEVVRRVYDKSIDLPILKGTQVTSMLDAKEVWIELQTYLSSLGNDKDVDLHMTDVEKAVNHGFDKKTSFRNPIRL